MRALEKSVWREEARDAFHSTKTFKNLKTAANGTENSRQSFQKFRKLLNFRNANHSTENSRNSGSKVEWKENFQGKNFENLGIPREVVPLFGNFNFGKWFWLNGKRPCFDSIVRSVIGWKISRHFSQPIKIETSTKRDLITSFFPRPASDANLYFEISLVHFFFISWPSTTASFSIES